MKYLISFVVLFYAAYAPPPPLTRSPALPRNPAPAGSNTQHFSNMFGGLGKPAPLPIPGAAAAIQMSASTQNQMAAAAIARAQTGNPSVLNAQATSGRPVSASGPVPQARPESQRSPSSVNSFGSSSSSASSVPTKGSLVRKLVPSAGLLAVSTVVAGVFGHELATKKKGSP
ncbi:hypothetical protein MP638_005884 [Amoeboaphelidium occidentale]|nr:hypothetical protein MP638_005884 [Amoeboaphelidium occidentale]